MIDRELYHDTSDHGEDRRKYSFDEMNHIHLLDDKPLYGTTTILSVLAKPLTWWASGLAVKELSGIEDPSVFTRIKNKKDRRGEFDEVMTTIDKWLAEHKNIGAIEYFTILDKAYRAHSARLADTAQSGIDLHQELERFVKNKMAGITNITYDVKIAPFVSWAIDNVSKFLWSEGYCYSEKHWFGGISDVGALLNSGALVIIDFKSSKSAYASYFLQAGGYDICISENGILDKEGNLLYKPDRPFDNYMILPFGAKIIEPAFLDSVNNTPEGCRTAFLASLILYKELQKMEEK